MYPTSFDAANKIWTGVEKPITIDRKKNFGEIILEALSNDSERVMQIDGVTGEGLTKAEIRIRTIRCAQNLTKLGCTQNDCIGIIARNHHNLTPLFYAALCLGIPISPLDVTIVDDGLFEIIERVGPSYIFCDADVLKPVKTIVDNIGRNAKLFTVDASVDGFDTIDNLFSKTGNEDKFICVKIDDVFSKVAVISCSSGTTGRAKSLMMSQASVAHCISAISDQKESVTLFFSSMYWFSGVMVTVLAAFKDTRIFVKHSFDPDLFLNLVEKYKVQSFLLTPRQLHSALSSDRADKVDLSSLRMCVIAGAILPVNLIDLMKKFIPHCMKLNGYGLTEVGSISFTAPMELEKYIGTVGMLTSNVEVKIINESGEKCGVGEEGEIFAKTPISYLGYYKNEEATKKSYDEEGYFMTGDLGYFDETNRLYIIGRKNEFFKSRDFAISTAEIENILLENQAICAACVVSIYDDKMITNLPAAVVVKNEQYSITEEKVYSLIAERLPKYKHLDGGVYFIDELPMTPSGKIAIKKITDIARNLYQQGKSQ